MKQYQKYPIVDHTSFIEKAIIYLGKFPVYCPVCGNISFISKINKINLRESCQSYCCNSTNRQRQMAIAICKYLRTSSLKKISKYQGSIYNTESFGPIHNELIKAGHYTCSEYFGNKYKSGKVYNGTLHQDLMNLSFSDQTFDIVLSSDVFEHISKPYLAHKEIYRVLKPGGIHIFTVPFSSSGYHDEKRASIVKGKIKHHLAPIVHLDGIRPDSGTLVYNIFSLEMVVRLDKIGFSTKILNIKSLINGVIGEGNLVFISSKNTF
ncbi:MAG: class I SAM-dependent methyltransferase [Candidatus Shapirobacteria bacterium]|jgi:SAM-dependent methyltransferase